MADLGTLVTIADRVFQLLQSPILAEHGEYWKSSLESLNNTVSSIKNLLLDADNKPVLSHVERGWVEELKEVLYEADDLFDKVITIAKQKEFNEGGAKLSQKVLCKVSRFFSSKNSFFMSYNTSQEIKSIQQKLSAISRDHDRYHFKADPQANGDSRIDDTSSFINETEENIIGRDDDVKAIVDMLLDPKVEENVGFAVVVGVGGLGKTVLAQLVFDHISIRTKFEKRLWACVSDHDGKKFNVQAILGKIIESSTNKKPDDISTMESMQLKFREELENKMSLLILDDVWTEDSNEWGKLRKYLTVGGRGSRVIVTTRSEKTANVVLGEINHSNQYMLEGLSDENSWRLFELTAFKRQSGRSNDPNLAQIGKMIVQKCFNVPLAIKVLGTLLYDQTNRWELFVKHRLPEIDTSEKPIMSILKLSYNNLEPSVKNCFKYCALFPKNSKLSKQKLISLWMAQGYIDDTEDYFSILLKRCFFHDVKKDDCGEITSFRIHDLIHDLAQEVARGEIVVVNSPTNNLGKKVRHLFIVGEEWTKSSFSKSSIRSCYMNVRLRSDSVKTLVANWDCLRSLCLCVPDSENLPESICKLLHLRYLDLSGSKKLKTLPSSFTELYNLQSLILYGCSGLKRWPKGFCKLVNLRLLDIGLCSGLSFMPLDIDKLTNLRELSNFSVGTVSSSRKHSKAGQLENLKFLVKLQGSINIKIGKNLDSEKDDVLEGGYLENIENLKVVTICFPMELGNPNNEEISAKNEEAVITKLQPHRNLKQLFMSGYYGVEIPRWGRVDDDWGAVLPNLVKIELQYCERLLGLPLLSNLKHLKSLSLWQLNNLEYIDHNAIGCGNSVSNIPFFPSLECLSIYNLERLKGWRTGIGEGDSRHPPFPRLCTLSIVSCPNLSLFPPCPSLKSLVVKHSNKSLQIRTGENAGYSDIKLTVETVDSVGYLTTLPPSRLTSIKIEGDQELKRLSEIEEVFKNCSSLRNLEISDCSRLVSISGVFEHLSALESLSLRNIPKLVDNEDDDGMPWRSLHHNLVSLELRSLQNTEILPRGLKHLTALQNLSIAWCQKLKGLPEWISCLSSLHSLALNSCSNINSFPDAIQNFTSLQNLEITNCFALIDNCQPNSEERAKIQHIPHISIYDQRDYWKRWKRRDG